MQHRECRDAQIADPGRNAPSVRSGSDFFAAVASAFLAINQPHSP